MNTKKHHILPLIVVFTLLFGGIFALGAYLTEDNPGLFSLGNLFKKTPTVQQINTEKITNINTVTNTTRTNKIQNLEIKYVEKLVGIPNKMIEKDLFAEWIIDEPGEYYLNPEVDYSKDNVSSPRQIYITTSGVKLNLGEIEKKKLPNKIIIIGGKKDYSISLEDHSFINYYGNIGAFIADQNIELKNIEITGKYIDELYLTNVYSPKINIEKANEIILTKTNDLTLENIITEEGDTIFDNLNYDYIRIINSTNANLKGISSDIYLSNSKNIKIYDSNIEKLEISNNENIEVQKSDIKLLVFNNTKNLIVKNNNYVGISSYIEKYSNYELKSNKNLKINNIYGKSGVIQYNTIIDEGTIFTDQVSLTNNTTESINLNAKEYSTTESTVIKQNNISGTLELSNRYNNIIISDNHLQSFNENGIIKIIQPYINTKDKNIPYDLPTSFNYIINNYILLKGEWNGSSKSPKNILEGTAIVFDNGGQELNGNLKRKYIYIQNNKLELKRNTYYAENFNGTYFLTEYEPGETIPSNLKEIPTENKTNGIYYKLLTNINTTTGSSTYSYTERVITNNELHIGKNNYCTKIVGISSLNEDSKNTCIRS